MAQERQLQINAQANKLSIKADIAPSYKPRLSKQKQKRLNIAFIRAVQGGSNEKVLRLINAGANVAAKNKYDKTALHNAAINGDTQFCALLIKRYAEAGGNVKEFISAKVDDGETALHLAAWFGHTETCAMLIEEYAKKGGNIKELISAKNNRNQTALHRAATNTNPDSDPETCILLMDEYAKAGGGIKELIAATDNDGWTALHVATWRNTRTTKFLKSIEKVGPIMGNEIFLFLKPFSECLGQ